MTISSKSKLEFFNSYGLVFEDHFYLLRHNSSSYTSIDSVKKIRVIKGREFQFNILILSLSFVMIYLSFLMESNLMVVKSLLYFVATVFLFSSYFFKKYTYRILLMTEDYQSFSIKVDTHFSSDAKEIVSKINKKIALKSNLLKAS
ncbi:hypothetical protein [Flavobacterium sp.]|uniref:hypothetical protein n=1 Tax=Flavobacterium sp. TaxID=239 RepID=UPI003751C5DC